MNKLLWQPDRERVENSTMYRFMMHVNQTYGIDFGNYESLYDWSVEHISEFWEIFWKFADIKASKPFHTVVDDDDKMPGTKWFQGARLNFAENLLRFRDDRTAIIFKNEGQKSVKISYRELYEDVLAFQGGLQKAGVRSGDRVVGFMPNLPQTVIAMLASVSLGAIWSSCSPDFGVKGILDRFGQIKPKIVVTADGYFFKGKPVDSIKKISIVLNELTSVKTVIVVPFVAKNPDISGVPNAVCYDDFTTKNVDGDIVCEQLPFDHPLYIMYSSGTTGLPKCLVQSAGGILLNHLKELMLHTDIKRDDTVFYYTTCGWMMWNWLVSTLATGATLVLYDGNPLYPEPGVLWEMAQDEKITVFGTSAGYISALMNSGLKPGNAYDLSALKTILSTGSPLSEEGFDFIYRDVKPDLQLSSISGGTDLNGCFALGNPMGAVYSGELQCRGLAMKVHAFNEKGDSVLNQQGELVCTTPFPSMPIHFWDDPDGVKYQKAYFNVYDNVWRHGDFIEINDRGGMVIYGRSDTTLNPGGVRIGTADIYRQVELFDEIEDSIVIGQTMKDETRIILFIQLANGYELTESLRALINEAIRKNTSPRHVPAKIISVPEIPVTLNMKKVELAVKNVVEGRPVLNKDAIKNPEALDWFTGLKELSEP